MKVLITISFVFFLAMQQSGIWEFEFEKDGIKVYTRDVEGSSFNAFRGEATFNASIEEIASVIMNIEDYPKWCYRTTSTKVIKENSSEVFYRYISESPIGVKNREGYFCSRIVRDSISSGINIYMSVFDPEVDVPSGFVRMPKSDGFWKLQPVAGNKTSVLFEMTAEPGGIIPGWLANMAATDSPYLTLLELNKLVLRNKRN